MRDFPSSFSETGVQVAATSKSGKTAQNLVTCVYSAQLCGRSCAITITWSKHRMGQLGLTIGVDDSGNRSLRKVDIRSRLFSKKKGLQERGLTRAYQDVFWDLSKAKPESGPEPAEGFYVVVLFDFQIVLLLGDLIKEAHRRTYSIPPPSNAVVFVAKREHIFGKKIYLTRAQFCYNGGFHDIAIECEAMGLKDAWLEIRIDEKRVMQVKRLLWKFKGNQTIVVDGLPVEVFWDVHNWLFDASSMSSVVFMFQSRASAGKPSVKKSSQMLAESQLPGTGFSLILYALKRE
ncbi:hypothetical protein KSP40_PGU020532 [Platanthera guangdongensis]|uniref:Uncharacterized protein n=1 Tax=Platanthera guangdongensis TaxID=2320717 RepID=A0ABR2MER8_9ASPA